MSANSPVITITDCGSLIVNVDATPTLDIIQQGVTFDCATDEYGIVLSVQPDGSVFYDRYLSAGTYSQGYIFFSGHGINFIVDISSLVASAGYGLTGATLSGDTLILTNTAGYNFYVDFSQFNYDDEILYLDEKIDSHTGNTNNPHQTSFYNLIQTAHTHTISDIIDISDVYFTGNTSGTCISDLYVHNLGGCSPINVLTDIDIAGGVTIAAGTVTKAPLQLNSGPETTISEIGTIEFLGDVLSFGINTPIAGALYTSQYPPVQDGTYVKATTDAGVGYEPYKTTDPLQSLMGDPGSWLSVVDTGNQRFHIDLGSVKTISRVYYENTHYSGLYVTQGVRNFTLWGSNDPTAFAELTFGVDTGWVQIIGLSQTEFDIHSAVNSADPKYITFPAATYRYFAFKFIDNWGYGTGISIRRIELQSVSAATYRRQIVLTDGIPLVLGKIPVASTGGRLIDSIISSDSGSTTINGSLTVSGITSPTISYLDEKIDAHTGDTTIHYTKNSIYLSELASSAHTHTVSEITDYYNNFGNYLPLSGGTLYGPVYGDIFYDSFTSTTLTYNTDNTVSATTSVGLSGNKESIFSYTSGGTISTIITTYYSRTETTSITRDISDNIIFISKTIT